MIILDGTRAVEREEAWCWSLIWFTCMCIVRWLSSCNKCYQVARYIGVAHKEIFPLSRLHFACKEVFSGLVPIGKSILYTTCQPFCNAQFSVSHSPFQFGDPWARFCQTCCLVCVAQCRLLIGGTAGLAGG